MAGRAGWAAKARSEMEGAEPATLWRPLPGGPEVRPACGPGDVAGLASPGWPGLAPCARGVRATMHAGRPWTLRQPAGFSTAEESHAFFRRALADGGRTALAAAGVAAVFGPDAVAAARETPRLPEQG